jgi:hypothetical protein
MPSEKELLPRSADILDRNDEVNAIMSTFERNYTRRKVVDTLLTIIIALACTIIILLLLSINGLDRKINTNDIHVTQMICEDLDQEQPNDHFVICQHVGRPQMNGVNK